MLLYLLVIYFLILGSFIVFFGKYFTYLFVSENAEMLIGNVDIFMKTIGITGIFLGILCIFRSCIQGMGHGTVSLTGGIIELAARAVIAAVTIYSGRFAVVCLGYPLAWLFAGNKQLIFPKYCLQNPFFPTDSFLIHPLNPFQIQ